MEKYNAEILAAQFAALIIKNEPSKLISNRETAANDIADFIQVLSVRFANEISSSRISLND